jgi:uncharacterized C2H2 Zn-finger protein
MNPRCHKTGYPTYDEARHVIKKMTFTARRKGKTARGQAIYKCPFCKAWHLTSHSYTIPKKDAA